jgi:hypothetical protein
MIGGGLPLWLLAAAAVVVFGVLSGVELHTSCP